MSDTITFYHNPQSRGRIVHWMLEETGAPYEIELLRFDKREHKAPAFLAVNPMGKIPAIIHHGVAVTESAAICAYLADAFPQAGLAPVTTEPSRGTYLRWLIFGATCVEHAALDKALDRPMPERPGVLGYGSYDDTMNALESALKPGPYILGDQFSAADVICGSQIGWGMMTKTIDPRPAFQAYAARCAERPAYKRAEEQCKALEEKLAKA